MKYNRVLIIAGSDSGGGAGVQADIKSASANGCFAATAITAVTVQNTQGVLNVFPLPEKVVGEQIDAVLSDIGADSVKIGMLHSEDLIVEVSSRLAGFRNIVLDPVMVATSGDRLLQDQAINALKERMLPMARIITPNIPETECLLGREIRSVEDMKTAAQDLASTYDVSVLVKGGHLIQGEMMQDVLFDNELGQCRIYESPRIKTKNTHGTGCTLSSAIAAGLAKGLEVQDAVKEGIDYINSAILAGAEYEIGAGHGPVHHFYKYW